MTVAKVTVYLPDALHHKVQELAIPISPTCQQALEKEVAIRTALDITGMERITLDMRDRYDERHWTVAFEGRWLVAPDDDNRTAMGGYDAGACYGVALTQHGRILVYAYHCNDGWEPGYTIYDTLQDAMKEQPDDIIAMAAAELGPDIAIELDI